MISMILQMISRRVVGNVTDEDSSIKYVIGYGFACRVLLKMALCF